MEIGSLIHNKLLVDFAGLKFSNNANCFTTVKKFFTAGSMEPQNCLITPVSTPEIIVGQSAGNTQTTRVYGYKATCIEQIEAADTDAAGDIKYSRLMNTADSMLDYLQKEPSNLNAWGNSNGISIFKIRTQSATYQTVRTESGFAALLQITFSVYLNVVPQNL